MSLRRWISVAGMVVAIASGAVATVHGAAEPEFGAQAALQLELRSMPPPLREGAVRLLTGPDVRDLVHQRMGETPRVRVTATTDDTVLLRSRGPTRGQAAAATKTYADSYSDVRLRMVNADIAVASERVRRKIDEVQLQLESAVGPQRASLVEVIGLLIERLDQFEGDPYVPHVVEFTPAEPLPDGARGAWIVAALGATVGIGAAASLRVRAVEGGSGNHG